MSNQNPTMQGIVAAEALARGFGQKVSNGKGWDCVGAGFVWKDDKVMIEVSEAAGTGMGITVFWPYSSARGEFGNPAVNRTKKGELIRCHGEFQNVIGHIASTLAEMLGGVAKTNPECRMMELDANRAGEDRDR